MSLVVVGLNHRSVPLDVLASTAVPVDALPKALHDLGSRPNIEEVLLLSTCMRTEVYLSTSRFHGALGDVRESLALWSGRPPEEFAGGVYDLYDRNAVNHLLRVAAGLESAVLGETDILRQVRLAADTAREAGTAGPTLTAVARRAVEAGKRVRTETAIARGTTSLSHTAVMLAAGAAADACPGAAAYEGRTCLVVGAGEMGAAIVQLLGAGSVLVANRTPERARRLGAGVVGLDGVPAALAGVDVLFTATAAPHPILDAAAVGPRRERPLVVVDLGVPRNVDRGVGELPGVTLYDLDDVKVHAEAAMASRRAEIPKAEAILADELTRWEEASAERAVAAPVVAALRARAEALRQAELERLGDLDPAQRRAVEAATKRMIAKLLHDPTVNLKAAAGGPRGERLAAALAELWGLDL